jgi:hypothetical protein
MKIFDIDVDTGRSCHSISEDQSCHSIRKTSALAASFDLACNTVKAISSFSWCHAESSTEELHMLFSLSRS